MRKCILAAEVNEFRVSAGDEQTPHNTSPAPRSREDQGRGSRTVSGVEIVTPTNVQIDRHLYPRDGRESQQWIEFCHLASRYQTVL